MATHDYIISNASGAAVRADLNNALAAIVSNNSNASSPSTTYAYQWWADTTTGQLKLRNSANSAWITIFELDGTMLMEDGTVSAPGLAFASDLNTGFFRSAADKINFATGGVERLEIGSSEVVFNDGSNDVDFRVESNGNTHMLFVDGGNDRVGIGETSVQSTLHVAKNIADSDAISWANSQLSVATPIAGNSTANRATIYFAPYGSDNNYAPSAISASAGTSGASTLKFFTNASGNLTGQLQSYERMRIDSSGNVGIGVSSLSSSSRLTLLESAGNGQTLEIKGANTGGAGSQPGIKFTASTGDNIGGIFGDTNSDAVVLQSGGTERMRIDSSGQLHIGNTVSSAHTNRLLSVGDTSRSAAFIEVRTSTSGDSGVLFSDGTDGTNSGFRGSVEYNHSSDFMFMRTAGTERMRIDSSGNVGIGTTTPTSQYGTNLNINDAGSSALHLTTGNSGTSNSDGFHIINSSGIAYLWNRENADTVFATNNTERMRIDSSGKLLVGRTGPDGSGLIQAPASSTNASFGSATGASTGMVHFEFRNPNGLVGTISTNGSATAYNISSDYRLKENVVDIANGITRVKQLSPRRFNFIADADTTVDGFLAHEAQTVVPEAVSGTHNEVDADGNAVMQGIDQSKLVPLLTAALQEAIAKIETLETKVAALEAG